MLKDSLWPYVIIAADGSLLNHAVMNACDLLLTIVSMIRIDSLYANAIISKSDSLFNTATIQYHCLA